MNMVNLGVYRFEIIPAALLLAPRQITDRSSIWPNLLVTYPSELVVTRICAITYLGNLPFTILQPYHPESTELWNAPTLPKGMHA